MKFLFPSPYFFYWFCLPFFLFIFSCDAPSSESLYSTDSVIVSQGRVLFDQHCAACHQFTTNGIGPGLGAVTTKVGFGWLTSFIQHPDKLIAEKDKRADSLFKKYKAIMPSFQHLEKDQIDALLAYVHTYAATVVKAGKPRQGVLDPYPEKIQQSGLKVKLVRVTSFPATASGNNMPRTRITKMEPQPGTGSIFVNDLRGILYKLKDTTPLIYLDFRKYFPRFTDAAGLGTGLGSFAFHPDFQNNGLLYTTHSEKAGSGNADFYYADSIPVKQQWVVTEWKTGVPGADVFEGTHRELMRINMVTDAHGVQEIVFNPLATRGSNDYGMLYIGIGDGMCVQGGYPALAIDKDKIWASVIRIDPAGSNSRNGRYGIPRDNPFALSKTVLPEIYADGFRNPHRITWTQSGKMLVSNIGQTNIESINWVKPGMDFGWPVREGGFVINPYGNLDDIFALPANDSIFNMTYPVAAFDHDEGNAITGGYEYLGKINPALKGKFFFGDITSGRLFYIELDDLHQGTLAPVKEWAAMIDDKEQSLRQVCGSSRVDLRFGRDAAGELYVMTKSDGRLYRMMPYQ